MYKYTCVHSLFPCRYLIPLVPMSLEFIKSGSNFCLKSNKSNADYIFKITSMKLFLKKIKIISNYKLELEHRLANEAASSTSLDVAVNRLTRGEFRSKFKRTSKKAWLSIWTAPRFRTNKLREITDTITPLPNSTCHDRCWE